MSARKSLGQINYETEKRQRAKLDARVEEEWAEWDELDSEEKTIYHNMAYAVQSADRKRVRRGTA